MLMGRDGNCVPNLRSGVFAPNVQHEHGGDED